ncbi:MAG: ABC transporter ATP-binding protein [Erysipelothrix sp.]|nr:ABC transporter ATP-binding protein [Erysipelothrix sp.]
MILAIIMGSLGFLCAIFITVFGAFGILNALNISTLITYKTLVISLLIFAFFRGVLRYTEQAANHYIAFKLLAIIRDKVFKQLRILAPAKLEGKDKGDLISLITSDIELIEVFYAHTISPIAIAFIVIGTMVYFISRFSMGAALLALLGYITVGILIPTFISILGKKSGSLYRDKMGDLGTSVLDSLRGLREVIQYDYGSKVIENLEEQSIYLSNIKKKTHMYEGLTNALTGFTISGFSVLVLLFCLNSYSKGTLTFDAILIIFITAISSFGPVTALANLSNNLILTFAAADRVLDLLDETPVTKDIIDGKDVILKNMDIQDLNFGYDNEIILEDFNLKIKENEVIGITGKSGSGKSTLLRLMMRFWELDSGSINTDKRNINQVNTSSLRKNQSFVTQDTIIFNESVRSNIAIAKYDAKLDEIINAAKKASIHNFIMTLPDQYDTILGEQGNTLSGGQRQRIGLARAFIHDSKMLLLDEPTSNLDSLNEGAIMKALYESKSNKTIIIVSHKNSALTIADRTININTTRNS